MTNKMESGIGIRVLLIYAGVAFVPLAVCFLHPLDFPLHYPRGDMATTLWNFWWFDQTFWSGRNPYWCDILFYPKGTYLYLHTFEFVDALVTTPVRLLLGGVFAWKVAVFLHNFWTCVAAHLLARRLGISRRASILVAVLLALSSYRTMNVVALSVTETGHAFFLAWAIVGCWQEPSRRIRGVWLGIAFVVLLFSNLYYLFFSGLLLGIAGVVLAVIRRPHSEMLRGWCVQLLLAGAIIVVPLFFMLSGICEAQSHLGTTPGYEDWVQVRGSAELAQFVVPAGWRALVNPPPPDAAGMTALPMRAISFCPPFFILLLAFAGGKNRSRGNINTVTIALIAVAVAAVFFAMGPRVKLYTTVDPADVPYEESFGEVPHWQGYSVPSPYSLLNDLPVFRHIRWNYRAGIFFYSAVLLLLAGRVDAGISKISAAMRARDLHPALLYAAIAAAVWFELRVPVYSTQPRIDESGIAGMAESDASGGVRVYPSIGFVIQGLAMYHQTLHEKPNFGGYLSRDPAAYEVWLADREWEAYFHELVGGRARRLTDSERESLMQAAREDNVRYLLLYKDFFATPERAQTFQHALVAQSVARVAWESENFAVLELRSDGDE